MNRNVLKALAVGLVGLSTAIAPAAFAMNHGGHHGGGHKSHHVSSHHSGGHHSSHHNKHHGGHHAQHHVQHHFTPKFHHVQPSYGHVTHAPVCLKFDWVIEHGHHKWACVLWQ